MLEFHLGISEKSYGNGLTPNEFCRSLPFYAEIVGEYYTNPDYFTKRDGLDNLLMIFTLEGLGEMNYMGQSCTLGKGSMVVIDCNKFQEYKTGNDGYWHFMFMHFSGAAIDAYKNILTSELTAVNMPDFEKTQKLFREFYEVSLGKNTGAYVKMSDIISRLLTDMVLSLASGDEKQNVLNRKEISELTAYIEENYEKDLHIEDFVRIARLSRYYLIHIFKKQTGLSPYQYLNMCRVNAAQKMLTSTDMTVEEISGKVGYSSPAVFIRHFKSFNKKTPLTYRKDALL